MCPGFLHEALALSPQRLQRLDLQIGKAWRSGWSRLWCPGSPAELPQLLPSFCPSSLHTFLPSGVPPCPLSAAPLPLFLGQELLICNSIGAKCFAKLLKQLKATG